METAAERNGDVTRRRGVVGVALNVFSARGYGSTSMDDIARAAAISRPGLYFLFGSKRGLFVEAVTTALDSDLAAVEAALGDQRTAPDERLLEAFDHWAGRYVGPLRDVSTMIDRNPELLGEVPARARDRFHRLLVAALGVDERVRRCDDVARVLLFASQGLQQSASSRDDYRSGMRLTVGLVLAGAR